MIARGSRCGAGAILLALVVLLWCGTAGAELVRVLIAEGKSTVTVASPGGLTLTDAESGRILLQRPNGAPVRLLLQGRAVAVREAGVLVPVVLVTPGRLPTVELEGRAYRGRLQVQPLNGGLAAVNAVELEEYLQGVVKDEIPADWPAEAAKAMAVAARTYAVYQLRQNPETLFHLRSTTASQMYGGATGEDRRTTWAVKATRGQVLTFGGQPISAFYHACSGGATEDGPQVFGVAFDMLVGVEDDFSLACPYALWIEQFTPAQIEKALSRAGYDVRAVAAVQPISRTRTGRVLRLMVDHRGGRLEIEGKRFREAVGNETLRSTNFDVRREGALFTFLGRGSGHGVGLSQWGAKEMADLAFQYQDILKFYYPLAQLRQLGD